MVINPISRLKDKQKSKDGRTLRGDMNKKLL